MNTIAALTRSDPARAEEAVEDLADLFRVNLQRRAAHRSRLREELEVARIYQRIEQLRLGERLQVRWKVGDLPMRALVPSLLLQPLLENADRSRHRAAAGRRHRDRARSHRGRRPSRSRCRTRCRPSAGLRAAGNRIALDNIRQRLELAYPGRSSVEVDDAGDTYRVRLRFPLVMGEGSGPP